MNDSPQPVPAVTMSSALRAAIWLLFVEAAGLVVVAGVLVWATVTDRVDSAQTGVVESGLAAGLAALLVTMGVFLRNRRAGARGPAVFIQLLTLTVGYNLIEADQVPAGVLVLAMALATAVLLVLPSTRADLDIE